MNGIVVEQDLIYLAYCGIAIGALAFISGLGQVMSPRENRGEARSRRMRMIAKGKSTEQLLALLRPPEKKGLLSHIPFLGKLSPMLRRCGYSISATMFLSLCLVAWGGVTLLATRYIGPVQAAALSAFLAFVLPLSFVHIQYNKRVERLVAQLPDALELMARGLRVGHPLNTTIAAVAEEMPDPLGTEFGIVYDQVTYGDELADAFRELAERIDVEDVTYLSASIGIQHGTGGDLARVIAALSKTIRARIAMRRRVRAISAEGRLSAWFLSALPIVIFLFTLISAPDYYLGVVDDPAFKPMAFTVVALVVCNALILRRLVNFRI